MRLSIALQVWDFCKASNGSSPCCSGDHAGLKKGPWTHEEDQKLKSFLLLNPDTSWRLVPPKAGLLRCGKSCRLRWMNYLRPDIKRGNFTPEEENLIIQIHSVVGNKWSVIASQLPGRTDNEIKNLWNTKLRKLLVLKGINPITHQPLCNPHLSSYVKQWVKSLENVIIAGLMTHSSSDNNNCNPIENPIEAPLSYSMSDQPPQQPLGVEDFTQTYLPNPIYDHSSATSTGITNPISDHSSTTTTTTTTINDTCFWVDETFQNYGSFIDDLMLDEGESLPSSLNDHVKDVLEEKASSPVIEMVSSDALVNWEEGLTYWNYSNPRSGY